MADDPLSGVVSSMRGQRRRPEKKPRARRGQSGTIRGTARSECPQRCYRGLPAYGRCGAGRGLDGGVGGRPVRSPRR